MSHPSPELLTALTALAEGRWEPEEWLSWWSEHADLAERELKRAWLLRVRPLGGATGPFGRTDGSHAGACYVLDSLGIPYAPSDRYRLGAQAEFEDYRRAEREKQKEQQQKFKPVLTVMKVRFPRFARFLSKRLDDVDEMQPGLSSAELLDLQRGTGAPLPAAYQGWLACVRVLSLDGLTFGPEHPFRVSAASGVKLPSEAMVCIADYFLEADGDQVLFAADALDQEDPPVYYYAHGGPEVRRLASSFRSWIESLPKSPVLAE